MRVRVRARARARVRVRVREEGLCGGRHLAAAQADDARAQLARVDLVDERLGLGPAGVGLGPRDPIRLLRLEPLHLVRVRVGVGVRVRDRVRDRGSYIW